MNDVYMKVSPDSRASLLCRSLYISRCLLCHASVSQSESDIKEIVRTAMHVAGKSIDAELYIDEAIEDFSLTDSQPEA